MLGSKKFRPKVVKMQLLDVIACYCDWDGLGEKRQKKGPKTGKRAKSVSLAAEVGRISIMV